MTVETRPRGSWAVTHGYARKNGSQPREYSLWQAMRHRCDSPSNPEFGNYGGRGIKVCERWLNFANFFEDMGLRPEGHAIERIDNDGDYEPSNCRWASWLEQARNRRNTHKIEWGGKTQCLTDWADELGMSQTTLSSRIRSGWSIEKALSRPVARWLEKGVR